MVLTKTHLMEWYSMKEAEVDKEIGRIREAKDGDVLFEQTKHSEEDRIATLIALANVPYNIGCRCDGPTIYYKGQWHPKSVK